MDCYSRDIMGGGKPLSAHTRKNLVAALIKIPAAFSIFASHKDEPVALVNCFEGFSTFACRPLINIHDVIVKSAYRGQNLSQMMLKKVEVIAEQRDACKLTLEVLDGNHIARAAYENFGFCAYQLDPEMGAAQFWEKKLHKKGLKAR